MNVHALSPFEVARARSCCNTKIKLTSKIQVVGHKMAHNLQFNDGKIKSYLMDVGFYREFGPCVAFGQFK